MADAHHLPFADQSANGVYCTGTLEHVDDPSAVLREIHRILKPGGIVHLEVPFMEPYHQDLLDY